MQVAPDSTSPRVRSGSGARCRYVKSVCRDSRRATSTGCGSLTLTIRSASEKTASASGTIDAPCAAYSSSAIAEPSPAPAWTHTLCPRSVSSRTPDGVSATRYSSALISVGTPTFTGASSLSVGGGRGADDLAAAQGEPELDAVAGGSEVAAGELLDLADPVAQRVAVAVEAPCGGLPLAVAL